MHFNQLRPKANISGTKTRISFSPRLIATTKIALCIASSLAIGTGLALAKGGTAKPVPGGGAGALVPQVAPNPLAVTAPAVPPTLFTAPFANTSGFDLTGFIQSATANDTTCPALGLPAGSSQRGGTVVVNGITIIVPCNTTLQFPAATFTWSDMLASPPFPQPLTIPTAAPAAGSFNYPTTEISVTGNVVNGTYIAGLIHIAQQSLNSGSGFISAIEYTAGVSTGTLLISATPGGPPHVRIQINDPIPAGGATGRYSQGQSPDARFSVDQDNPTITAASGYPMCIPRTSPADDPLCPRRNRPAPPCRNFGNAGVVSPAGWELSGIVNASGRCNSFVMKAPLGTTPTVAPAAARPVSAAQIATLATEPDARQQAPLTVGDYINFSGTVMRGTANPADPAGVTNDMISVHTIQANVGIFTQPGSLPVYIWIEETIVGADATPVAGLPLAPLEGQDRLVVVGRTTDVITPVDLYFIDLNPATGATINRWVTMESMTGGITPGTQPFGGGITTQLIGPQPGRVRARGPKATPGVLVSPTRYVRMVSRSLCAPANSNPVANPGTVGTFFDINQTVQAAFVNSVAAGAGVTAPCTQRAQAANGLNTGQYFAPISEYIFPENVVAGDTLVPNNFWSFDFLASGEGPGTGPLSPTPW